MKLRSVFFYLFTTIWALSCSSNESPKIDRKSTSIYKLIPNDSLESYVYRIEAPKGLRAENDFKNNGKLPTSWVGLSKNALGFFVYHRGRGLNSSLIISETTLQNSGFGETISWNIQSLENQRNDQYSFELGERTLSSSYARCTLKIIDLDTLYAIQTTKVFQKDEEGKERLLGEYSGIFVP